MGAIALALSYAGITCKSTTNAGAGGGGPDPVPAGLGLIWSGTRSGLWIEPVSRDQRLGHHRLLQGWSWLLLADGKGLKRGMWRLGKGEGFEWMAVLDARRHDGPALTPGIISGVTSNGSCKSRAADWVIGSRGFRIPSSKGTWRPNLRGVRRKHLETLRAGLFPGWGWAGGQSRPLEPPRPCQAWQCHSCWRCTVDGQLGWEGLAAGLGLSLRSEGQAREGESS